jgi:hypothetical protein
MVDTLDTTVDKTEKAIEVLAERSAGRREGASSASSNNAKLVI